MIREFALKVLTWATEARIVVAALALVLMLVNAQRSAGAQVSYIDTHSHLECNDDAAVQQALNTMDSSGIEKTFVMPAPNVNTACDFNSFLSNVVNNHLYRFAFLDGGTTLNKIIQESLNTDPSNETLYLFEQIANNILSQGAVGFGEMAALHFAKGKEGQDFLSAPPDHTLFLKLADIAANNNVVIDLHMEAVPCVVSTDEGCGIPLPQELSSFPNPPFLHENISALERLLEHNRNARIVWDHAGWDNTGYRTIELMRSLLERHPNLYMNIKIRGGTTAELPNLHRPLDDNYLLRPEWLDLISSFPTRFAIGVDSKYPDISQGGIQLTRTFLDQLPADLAGRVGFINPTYIYGLHPQYTLTVFESGTGSGTVTSSPAGINCGDDCSETYTKIQRVKLTAKADTNSTFTGWSGGGCSGTKTCTVTVDAAVTVTASFERKVPHISVSPDSLAFYNVKVGKSLKKTLKIANDGTGDLSVSIGSLGGTDFSVAGIRIITVKPKKSYKLSITFKPASTGDKTGTLVLTSNDPDALTLSISLSGTGI
jgi:hypothetical protein